MARAKQEKKARGAQKGRRAMTELMKEGKLPVETAALVERKKPGRKPMTEEQKAEAKRAREEAKAAEEAAELTAKAMVYVQYAGAEAEVRSLAEAAKADFKQAHKRTKITSLRLYIKPEDYAAYYVVNETFAGKVDL